MKIGLFIDTYHPKINGVITSVDSLKNGLQELGHQVYIITGGNVTRPTSQGDIILLPSFNVKQWNIRMINLYSKSNIEFIKSFHFDIVHSHTESTVGLLANIISKTQNIPNIHTYHTMYGDYKYYVFKNVFHLGDMLEKFIVNNFCKNNVNELIVPSEKIKDYLKTNFYLEKEPIIIKTGMDKFPSMTLSEKLSFKKSLGFDTNDFLILNVGRIAKEKNVDFLVDCQRRINKVDKNIKLVFVGDGPYLRQLKYTIRQKNLTDSIRVIGKISHNEMYKYYQIADLTVTASTTETQGLTVLESLQNGIPVVCIDDSAFEYIVQSDYNGQIFHDEDEYISKIVNLKRNKEILLYLKNNCIDSGMHFNSINYAENVNKVYKNIR